MSFSSFCSQLSANAGAQNTFSVVMQRSFTRLKTHVRDHGIVDLSAADPQLQAINILSSTRMVQGDFTPAADTVEFTLALGMKEVPRVLADHAVRGVLSPDAWPSARPAGTSTLMITGSQFRNDRFHFGRGHRTVRDWPCVGANFTGLSSTRARRAARCEYARGRGRRSPRPDVDLVPYALRRDLLRLGWMVFRSIRLSFVLDERARLKTIKRRGPRAAP